MELSPFIVIFIFSVAEAARVIRERRERKNAPRRRPEPTPNQRRAFMRVYNAFYNS